MVCTVFPECSLMVLAMFRIALCLFEALLSTYIISLGMSLVLPCGRFAALEVNWVTSSLVLKLMNIISVLSVIRISSIFIFSHWSSEIFRFFYGPSSCECFYCFLSFCCGVVFRLEESHFLYLFFNPFNMFKCYGSNSKLVAGPVQHFLYGFFSLVWGHFFLFFGLRDIFSPVFFFYVFS